MTKPARASVPVGLPSNALDRLVTIISPARGLARMEARTRLLLTGGYVGARTDRPELKSWTPQPLSADADIVEDLEDLRGRSRDLARNSPIAAGALNTLVTNTIGAGLVPRSQIDFEYLGITEEQANAWNLEAERIWWYWAGSQCCDLSRTQNFAGLEALAFRSYLESGDVLSIRRFMPRRAGDLLSTRVQLVEADRLCNPLGKPDTPSLIGGVELDPATGEPIAYHIKDTHPGDLTLRADSQKWNRVPAFGAASGDRIVRHIFDRTRPGQTRGVPLLAPVIQLIKQLTRYSDSEVQAAVISSFFTVFVKSKSSEGAGGLLQGNVAVEDDQAADLKEKRQIALASGMVVGLDPDEDISIANPGRPNVNFDPFFVAIVRQIGAALEIPFEILLKHFTASYSASRAAMLEFWKRVIARRGVFIEEFCQPTWEWVIEEAVARGYLHAPGFFADPLVRRAWLEVDWRGPTQGQIDELKAVKAAAERVGLGISTLAEETASSTGGDWQQKHHQRKREHAMRVEAGLEQPVLGKAPAVAAVKPEAPTDAEDE